MQLLVTKNSVSRRNFFQRRRSPGRLQFSAEIRRVTIFRRRHNSAADGSSYYNLHASCLSEIIWLVYLLSLGVTAVEWWASLHGRIGLSFREFVAYFITLNIAFCHVNLIKNNYYYQSTRWKIDCIVCPATYFTCLLLYRLFSWLNAFCEVVFYFHC